MIIPAVFVDGGVGVVVFEFWGAEVVIDEYLGYYFVEVFYSVVDVVWGVTSMENCFDNS